MPASNVTVVCQLVPIDPLSLGNPRQGNTCQKDHENLSPFALDATPLIMVGCVIHRLSTACGKSCGKLFQDHLVAGEVIYDGPKNQHGIYDWLKNQHTIFSFKGS